MRWTSLTAVLLALPALAASAAFAEPTDKPITDADPPMTPGLHYLKFDFERGGEREVRRYGMYLPPQVERATADEGAKLPLVVFLYGTGSRGLKPRGLRAEGPLAAARRHGRFRRSIDYAILVPQIDRRERYENDRIGAFVAAATQRAVERWPIDPDRVYLVGMSMGGGGVWYAAMAAPDRYAAIASMAGHAHKKPDKVAEALKHVPIFLTVGSVDRRFFAGSSRMAEAFEAVDADLTWFKVPGRGHNVWRAYLGRPAFYDWLLKHRRGADPPPNRASAEQMLNWAMNPPGDPQYHAFMDRLQKQFADFAPWWHIEYCGRVEGVGLREEHLGRDNVFVTHPLNRKVPCRIMITAEIPADKRTRLHLRVGHAEGEDWRLRVYVDGRRRLNAHVGRGAADGENWHDYAVDLTDHAGEAVFIEMLSEGRGGGDARAAWHRIELRSEPREKPADG